MPVTWRCFGGLVVAGLLMGCRKPDPGPPVVALVTIDTWRLDHFSAAHTPNLWRLAEEGERYTNAWSPIGLTSPAHATMLTGLLPWEHGMEANNHHGFSLPVDVPRVLDDPAFEGWAKAAFVSAFPAGPEGGLDVGFDHFDGPESGERPGTVAVTRALDWLPTDRPAFLWVHVYEPHGPYEGTADDDPGRYAQEVARADTILAPLLSALVDRRARVVVAADHGEVLLEERCGRQHERSVSDHVLRVPLVRWTPARPGLVRPELVGLEDVPALLLGQAATVDAYRLAESGICEPGCSVGCAPTGVAGRDRLGISVPGRALKRGGQVRVLGQPVEGLVEAVSAIPDVVVPGTPDDKELEALGYSTP